MISSIIEYTLENAAVGLLRKELGAYDQVGRSVTSARFYDQHWDIHVLLPPSLRRFLEDLRRNEPAAAGVVHGFPVNDRVGTTPDHWSRVDGLDGTVESDLFMAACALELGEPFSWGTLQHGRMIQDVFPIRGDEQRLNGHGSEAFLVFHTDDAFHPASCDYLLLFGVRNDDKVPTYVSSVRDVRLDPRHRAALSENRFYIVPDDEHIRQLETKIPDSPLLQLAIEMRDQPRPTSVLFGAAENPYLRLDGPYMRCIGDDPLAERALVELHEELERVQRAVVVGQGDLLILDNRVAAHARQSFHARYDGTDRWLRKIIVSRGQRKWQGNSAEPAGRVLF